jgi:hypothetical protein
MLVRESLYTHPPPHVSPAPATIAGRPVATGHSAATPLAELKLKSQGYPSPNMHRVSWQEVPRKCRYARLRKEKIGSGPGLDHGRNAGISIA